MFIHNKTLKISFSRYFFLTRYVSVSGVLQKDTEPKSKASEILDAYRKTFIVILCNKGTSNVLYGQNG